MFHYSKYCCGWLKKKTKKKSRQISLPAASSIWPASQRLLFRRISLLFFVLLFAFSFVFRWHFYAPALAASTNNKSITALAYRPFLRDCPSSSLSQYSFIIIIIIIDNIIRSLIIIEMTALAPNSIVIRTSHIGV